MENGDDDGWCSKKKKPTWAGNWSQECSRSSAELICPHSQHCVTHLGYSTDATQIPTALCWVSLVQEAIWVEGSFFFSNYFFLKKLAELLHIIRLIRVLHISKDCCLISSRRTPKIHLSFQTDCALIPVSLPIWSLSLNPASFPALKRADVGRTFVSIPFCKLLSLGSIGPGVSKF